MQAYNKAIVALIGSLIFFLSEFTDLEPDFIGETTIQAIATVLTTILVYIIPNKEPETT